MNTLNLSDAERRLIEAARDGLPADLKSANEAENDPAQGYGWGSEGTIRAEVIHALATGARDDWPVHPKGIQLYGAKIAGQLDLGAAEIRCRLALINCRIEEPIILAEAKTKSISLESSYIKGINAERLEISGGFDFTKARVIGEVGLVGANISGRLLCRGAHFDNPTGCALNSDEAKIGGGAFLDEGFCAHGEVRFLYAWVGGPLICGASKFRNDDPEILKKLPNLNHTHALDDLYRTLGRRPALALDGLRVRGLFLNDGFTANGEVRLVQAEIGNDFDCSNGNFLLPNGSALSADGATVHGTVFLSPLDARGSVSAAGAKILRDFICGGRIENLILDRAQISGALALAKLEGPSGKPIDVDLTHAKVGKFVYQKTSLPTDVNLYIDGFEYDAIVPGSPRDVKSRFEWLERISKVNFSTQPYEQLEKVLRASGDERGAVEVFIAKRRAIREKGRVSRSARAWDWILDSAVGYGYGVWKTALWSLAVVVLGAILFGFWFPFEQTPKTISASPQSATVATASSGVRTKPPAHLVRECVGHALHSFFYSLEVFLPFDGTPWRSSQPLRPRYAGDLWFYLIEAWCVIEELLGWLAAGLIAAAAAGVIQK